MKLILHTLVLYQHAYLVVYESYENKLPYKKCLITDKSDAKIIKQAINQCYKKLFAWIIVIIYIRLSQKFISVSKDELWVSVWTIYLCQSLKIYDIYILFKS